MTDSSTSGVVTTTESPLDTILQQAEAPEAEAEAEAPEAEAPEQDEKTLNTLLKRAESAFTKGNKSLLLSRVECGKWCHAIYVFRMDGGHKDRSFTSMQIFSRLAVHADNRRECDGTLLAKLFKTVELLSAGDNWKALTLGKLEDLSVLVTRTEGTEVYSIFDIARTEDAKALFTWACGDGLKRPSREDIKSRVTEITDPEKFKELQARKAAKKAESANGADADADVDDETEDAEAPENLITTEATVRPTMPDWKDVPDGMAALFQEGCKQQPGKSSDMMMNFAKQLIWTTPMLKGLIAGIADGKNGERAEQALQELVDAVADEYSIYPQSEVAAEAA